MVTVTLKLGISILNGGNILVQQVHLCLCGGHGFALFLTAFALTENAGLPEGEKRRGILQEPVWADDVLQVTKRPMLLPNTSRGPRICV